MARELGGSQISALLEAVPGIRSVLRSPVADAIVHMIRAGAGLESFRLDLAQELVQYSVRRGLIGADEGDELMQDVTASARGRRAAARGWRLFPSSSRNGACRQSHGCSWLTAKATSLPSSRQWSPVRRSRNS